MASFAGVDLGPFARVRTMAARSDLQISAYPGVMGLAALDLGSRGGASFAEGACVADTLAGLAVTEQQFRALVTYATLGVLVDTLGTAWPNVILVDFQPQGDVVAVSGYGWGREYRMEFLHLS